MEKCAAIRKDAVVILFADWAQRASSPLFHDARWPVHCAQAYTGTARIHTRCRLSDFTEEEKLCTNETVGAIAILFQRSYQHFILGLTARVKGHSLSARF